MSEVSAAFGKPFALQVAAFRLRLAQLQPTWNWKDVWQAEHDRAFMVAGAQKAELLADLAAAIDKAITKGTTLEEFRRDFAKAVEDHNWHGWTGETTEKGRAWRTRVIYRTNLATSFAAGRLAQLRAENLPLWVYFHGNSREPRVQHLAWDGLILPSDHPFWDTHFPPNGWGCSCRVTGARSMREAIRLGGKPNLKLSDDWADLNPKTGAPDGIDKGWAYAPGASSARTLLAVADRLSALPAPLGAELVASFPQTLTDIWSEQFSKFVDEIRADVPRGRQMIVGALKPSWVQAAQKAEVQPISGEIIVREEDIRHTFRSSKRDQIQLSWYRDLPGHLRKPDAVLLDLSLPGRPALLLIYGQGANRPKLVLQINYRTRRQGRMNIVETGKMIDPTGIALGDKMRLIEGEL